MRFAQTKKEGSLHRCAPLHATGGEYAALQTNAMNCGVCAINSLSSSVSLFIWKISISQCNHKQFGPKSVIISFNKAVHRTFVGTFNLLSPSTLACASAFITVASYSTVNPRLHRHHLNNNNSICAWQSGRAIARPCAAFRMCIYWAFCASSLAVSPMHRFNSICS